MTEQARVRLASFSAALVLAALPLLAAVPAHAAPAVSCDEGDDGAFSFESYDADFYLDVDADGRSTLRTVETFVALFPDIDQNQGMRRAIPLAYQGHPTDVSVESVTDGEGNPRPFEAEEDEDGEFLLVTSRADECVHGAQTYVFTYTQHNVTLYPDDSPDEEFYWDTNGTGSDQPYGTATSRVHVPAALAASLTGDASCYRGVAGSTTSCDLKRSDEDGGVVFTTTEADLGPRENVTVDIAFSSGTFVPRDDAYFGSPLGFVQLAGVGGSAIAVIWAAVLRRTRLADGRGRPTIIAEYSPPKGMDPFTASVLLKKTGRAAAATFMDLAVRRAIRIIEVPGTGFFSRGPSYVLELVDASGLEGPELNLAQALFGYQLQPGTQYAMTGKDTTLSEKVRGIIQTATAATTTDGLRAKPRIGASLLPTLLALLAGVVSFVAGVTMLDSAVGGVAPFLLLGAPILAVVLVFGIAYRIPLTAQGAELRDHLKGLELYIRLAEADRLRMLQSPTGAEKEATSTTSQVVKVYEKLLPYAVLFSLEKEWAAELGRYYVDETPDYYSGSGAFNAAVFASSIGGLSSSAASSFSGSSSSSSSSGGGGGGSSGGGGGGGGAGGV
ncbi:MAG: hypothetical protein BGO97_00655 [Micrococcales bacterium 70-64]|nr:DUF2207 domain-containing protein [Leifsonia sp.]ODU65737.1 MAG: hypothetical protein ABT06_00655 [Leifsonia sp. SCN 70-46]OJX84364.1 MAG: hypothetical protein BGO97_00655 [Micrococcales bacterium 70-64]